MPAHDKKLLRRQIINFFPSYYTTLISIVQATSFAYLLFVLSKTLLKGTDLNLFHALLLMTFLVIIQVWYEYMMGSAALRWLPSFCDSLIPFLLGLTQFSLIFSIESEKNDWWYFSVSSLCIVSLIAYHNMYRGARQLKDNKTNEIVLLSLGKYPIINEICAMGYAIAFFIFGVIEKRGDPNPYFLITSMVLVIAFMWRGWYYWRRIVR